MKSERQRRQVMQGSDGGASGASVTQTTVPSSERSERGNDERTSERSERSERAKKPRVSVSERGNDSSRFALNIQHKIFGPQQVLLFIYSLLLLYCYLFNPPNEQKAGFGFNTFLRFWSFLENIGNNKVSNRYKSWFRFKSYLSY